MVSSLMAVTLMKWHLACAGITLSAALVGQGYQFAASVTASEVFAQGCPGAMRLALPLGPVLAPIRADALLSFASATAAITPQTATVPLVLEQTMATSSVYGFCPQTQAKTQLDADLIIGATGGGQHVLRILWDGSHFASPGFGYVLDARWTLSQVGGGFQWTEVRASLPGRPLYLDVPLDLSQPVRFNLSWLLGGSAFYLCRTSCTFVRSSGSSRMSFAARPQVRVHQEGYGAPCQLQSGQLPLSVAYDPFGVPGLDQVEAMLVVGQTPFRPVVLMLGASRDRIGAIPLPFDLTPLGAPGCSLLQDAVVVVPAALNQDSYAVVPLGTEVQLLGLGPVYLQWIVPDAVNALGLTFSNGTKLEVR